MILYLMRHAEALDARAGQADADRPLTEKGLRRSQDAAAALVAMDVRLDLVLTSPLLRAVQTAEIVAGKLQVPLQQAPALASRVTTTAVSELLKANGSPEAVMLVGHEPDLSALVGEMIGGGEVQMSKGAIACIDAAAAWTTGTLLWLMGGRQLSLIGASER